MTTDVLERINRCNKLVRDMIYTLDKKKETQVKTQGE